MTPTATKPGTAWAAARRAGPGPGRPPSDAPERIRDAAYAVLKRDGYAGLTTAKVAAASGQNKAMIAYYYGSKQGLVEAVARHVSAKLIDEVLGGLGDPRTPEDLVRGLADGVWRAMDRDDGLQRTYFDLASQTAVEPKVREVIAELKAGYRAIVGDLLRNLDDPPSKRDLEALAVYLIAAIEGLALERLERGETRELVRAREIFVSAARDAIRSA